MKTKSLVILLFLFNALTINTNSQTLTLKLWPDGIPGFGYPD